MEDSPSLSTLLPRRSDSKSIQLNHKQDPKSDRVRPRIFVISTIDEEGIRHLIPEYSQYFKNLSLSQTELETFLHDLAHTLYSRRSSLKWKSFLLASSLDDLQSIGAQSSIPRLSVSKPVLGLIFTGQGAQWAGMGHDLTTFATFDRSIRDSEQILTSIGCPWSLQGKLLDPQ